MAQSSALTRPKTPTCSKVGCPSEDDLAGLIGADTPVDRLDAITEHLGDCEGCQQRLDSIATGEVPVLAAAVRARRRTVRLPDALVAATGAALEADAILTTDRRLS